MFSALYYAEEEDNEHLIVDDGLDRQEIEDADDDV